MAPNYIFIFECWQRKNDYRDENCQKLVKNYQAKIVKNLLKIAQSSKSKKRILQYLSEIKIEKKNF